MITPEEIKTENLDNLQNAFSKADVSQSTKSTPGMKRVQGKIVEDEVEIEVPEGWRRQVVQRQGGLSAGKFDVYYFSPLGKKLRSKKEVQAYCEKNNIEVNFDLFRFSKVSLNNEKSKKLASPKTDGLTKTPKVAKQPKAKNLNLGSTNKKVKSKTQHLEKIPNSIKTEIGSPAKKKRKTSNWVPPKSPFNLFQENMHKNPWKLLIGTIILNKSGGDSIGKSLLMEFFKKWPTPESAMKGNYEEMADLLKHMPNTEKIAKIIIKFSEEFLNKKWTYPKELHGIGKYGNDSYRIFCINEWKKVKPSDYLLTFYVDWLWDNHTVLELD